MKILSPIPKRRSRIVIIPLIDIMFFLLASFMMISLQMSRTANIKLNLPAATQARQDYRPDMLNIAVDKSGAVWLEKKEISLPELGLVLSNRFDADTNLPVYISGDRDTLHGNMVKVYQIVRTAGIQNVAFMTDSKSSTMKIRTPIPEKKSRLEIIPLIDIMFFLLASFMMVSLQMQIVRTLKANLPTATLATSTKKPDTVNLNVNKDGQVSVDDKAIAFPELFTMLTNRYSLNTKFARLYHRCERRDAWLGDVCARFCETRGHPACRHCRPSRSRPSMKNFQQNLLIVLALALCGLCVFQWYEQTAQRNAIQKLNQMVYDRNAAIQNYTNSIATLNFQVNQMDARITEIKAQAATNAQLVVLQKAQIVQLQFENENLTNEIAQYKSAVDELTAKLKDAYAGIEKQNAAISNLISQRDDLAKKFNDGVKDRNDVVTKYNDLVKQMEKQNGSDNLPGK